MCVTYDGIGNKTQYSKAWIKEQFTKNKIRRLAPT
jgi:hypothetical protein